MITTHLRARRRLLTAISGAAIFLLMLASSSARSQQRTTFAALGNADQRANITVSHKNGATYYTTDTRAFASDTKTAIAAQKSAGFKKVEKATFLATAQNPLEASFEVEKGYTYRAVVVHGNTSNDLIVTLRDPSRDELSPQVSLEASGQGGFVRNPVLSLADYTPAADGTAILGIGMMMGQRNDPAALQLLMFRKKN